MGSVPRYDAGVEMVQPELVTSQALNGGVARGISHRRNP